MKIKSEKGFTVIDIAISIVVLFIFVSLIAMLVYSVTSSSQEIELKSKATEIAVQEIEKLKNKKITEIQAITSKEVEGNEGFYEDIIVQDYNEINKEKQAGIVKKVTVKIQYKFKKETKSVELSTIISREN